MVDIAGGATMRQDEHRFTSKSDLTGQRRVDPLGDTHGCSNECFEYGGRPQWVAPSRFFQTGLSANLRLAPVCRPANRSNQFSDRLPFPGWRGRAHLFRIKIMDHAVCPHGSWRAVSTDNHRKSALPSDAHPLGLRIISELLNV